MKKSINLESLPKAGPYSHAIESNNIVFVAGQTGEIEGEMFDFETQFISAVDKINKILASVGLSLDDVVKVTVYLKDRNHFKKMNELFQKFFPKSPPARTTILADFVNPNVLVEIDVIAIRN